MAKKEDTDWYKFELAVKDFLSAMDPSTIVTHDVSIPDRDTGKPRQRDVWIETKVCGFKVKIYVSCKNYGKVLNQQDIDAVIGELRSSGANKGVVFSKLGFAKDAITKAKINDIECCSLVNTENHQRIIPDSIIIKQFARKPWFNYQLNGINNAEQAKIFFQSHEKADGVAVINNISDLLKKLELESIENNIESVSYKYSVLSSEFEIEIQVTLFFGWRYYCADLAGYLVNGYYNFGDSEVKGEIVFPSIDRKNPDLGPDWIKCEKPTTTNFILLSLVPENYLEDLKNMIRKI